MTKIKRSILFFVAFPLFLACFILSDHVYSEPPKVFTTYYCTIHYSSETALNDFFWRITGRRFELADDLDLAKSRVDRLVDRVQSILDMFPSDFHVNIELRDRYEEGMIALYNRSDDNIVVYVNKITDGILAHELAHAVINDYFVYTAPYKIQEVLAQYVDTHLWTNY